MDGSRIVRCIAGFLWLFCGTAASQSPTIAFRSDPNATFEFGGLIGDRIEANTNGWLLRAPRANPGMLTMFALRDREPRPEIVPWAGEFVGKYLISAIQGLRLDADPRLIATVESVVRGVIASQAEDGYLGPFPADERLLEHWDLWGHYHIMLGLLMWHERTGDAAALESTCRAADLVCRIYLAGGRRPRDAGSTEMNLAIVHAFGWLYRITRNDRYLQMMRVIEEDWEREGDYLRTGLAGTDFYLTPKPRWESLPDLQGLFELYQITGDRRYRTAFLHHWNSIRQHDRRNTGGFSSGEQATGTPFESTAIETCCTIAWMALTLDALRLTGDPLIADELELSTFNGMLGAQHPSGSWWTYNTPMNGVREASHHTIVFQSRAGTPDLNCCSVNAPRGLGMLSEWAVMHCDDGIAINYLGPLVTNLKLEDEGPLRLEQQSDYPLDGEIKIAVRLEEPREFAIRLRIPGWATHATVSTHRSGSASADGPPISAAPGAYAVVQRRWSDGDVIDLQLDLPIRYLPGGGEMTGRMSVYRGPVLLAYDVLLNRDGAAEPPVCTPAELQRATVKRSVEVERAKEAGQYSPWLTCRVPLADGGQLDLCDFASAGAHGSRYVSWLPAALIRPPPPAPDYPASAAAVPPGRMVFRIRRTTGIPDDPSIHLVVADNAELDSPIIDWPCGTGRNVIVPAEQTNRLVPGLAYYWRLISVNEYGRTPSLAPARRIQVDPALVPLTEDDLTEFGENADGVLVEAALRGTPEPAVGRLRSASGWSAAVGADGAANGSIELNAADGLLVYPVRQFPSRDYTVRINCQPLQRSDELGQVFSAWCRAGDDPLRICVEGGRLYARIEASGGGASTSGVAVHEGTWIDICVVKRSDRLSLFIDGTLAETIRVPPQVVSAASDFAIGGNPHFTGYSEHLACRVAGLQLLARAISDNEVPRWMNSPDSSKTSASPAGP